MEQTEMPMELTLEQMDAEVAKLRQLKEDYEEKKAISNEAHFAYKAQQERIIQLLEDNDKTTYICEGIGRITLKHKLQVTVPKTVEEKRAFFNWLGANMGEDVRDAYMTVNSNTLNSFYREMFDTYAARGEVLHIDGLSEATSTVELSFTKR